LKSSGERYKKLRDAGKPLYQIKVSGSTKAAPAVVKETPAVTEEASEEKVSNLLDVLGAFDPSTDTPDDLKKVKGIGPQMEKTLNQIGIYSFAQVSKMTDKEYDLLDSITGSFPGRAQRDDWAGQAKDLNNKK